MNDDLEINGEKTHEQVNFTGKVTNPLKIQKHQKPIIS